LAGLGFYLFIVHSLTTAHPFLDRGLFRDRNYATSLIFTFAVGIILLATIAVLTPFLQLLVGLPIVTAGLVLGPRGIGTMIMMLFISRLVNLVDARLLLMTGFGLLAISLWQMTEFTADVNIGAVISASFIQGLGLGLIWVPLSTTAFATLSVHLRTQAASLVSLVRNLGSSIGISVVIFLLGYNARVARTGLAEQVTVFNENFRDLVAMPLWSLSTRFGQAAIEQEVVRQATLISYIVDFKLMMAISILTIPMLLLLRTAPRTKAQTVATE
jgi:DHA2 family multidrug resistance protein